MKKMMIAAFALASAAAPALAQQGAAPAETGTAGSEKVNIVIVYGDDACPQSQGDDIVVCARKGEEERFRIPEPLRGDPNKPSNQAWGERVRAMEYVGRSGTESCSPSGAGGATGCFAQLARLAKAERQQADNASWKDLVAAEREKRLSDLCFLLNIEDSHVVNYSLKKLSKLDLVATDRRGKETFYAISAAGEALCGRYREIRESCLISSHGALSECNAEIGEAARMLRVLSGLYDQAARAAASL